MFLGVVDAYTRNWIRGNAECFKGRKIVVGCSGNFTTERLLREYCAPKSIHSNDVSLYSTLLGKACTGEPCKVWRDSKETNYSWIDPYLDEQNPLSAAALMMVLMRMLAYEKQKNEHQIRMWGEYERDKERLVKETLEKLETRVFKLDSYMGGDIEEHFRNHEGTDAIFCSYMPFYKGGYETIYKRVTQILCWNAPEYSMVDDNFRDRISEWCMDKDHVVMLNYPIEGKEPVFVEHNGRNNYVYIYSNLSAKKGVFRRKRTFTNVRFQILSSEHEFTTADRVTVHLLKNVNDIAHYKDLWLSHKIDYSIGTYAFAVMVNGLLAGFVEYTQPKFPGDNCWYLMADFPIEPKPHKRLSKLIAAIALCEECEDVLVMKSVTRRPTILTTATTNKPVSMKYRGIFKVSNRGKDATGQKFINYTGEFKGQKAQEIFEEWLTRIQK